MKKLLKFLVSHLVDHPDKVVITEKQSTEHLKINQLDLEVAKTDMGQVIGKNGVIIKALRDVLRIKAMVQGTKVVLNLKEN